MKHRATYRRRAFPALFLGLSVGLGTPAALAQPAPATTTNPAGPALPPEPAPLPAGTTTAPAISPAHKTAIANFVNGHFARMATNDGVATSASRKALEAQAGSAARPSSAAFQAEYAAAVNAAALKALASPDVRVRVSAIAAVDRLGTVMPNNGLAPAVLAAMGARQNEAVIQAGVKAARNIYPTVINGNQGTAMIAAVTSAVYAYPDSTSTVGEAIAADAFEVLAPASLIGDAAPPATRQAALNGVIALLNARAAGMAKADPLNLATIPPTIDPTVEARAIVYLYQMWPSMIPQQQGLAGRALLDLATEATRIIPLVPPRQPGQIGVPDPKELAGSLVRNPLSSIQVAARNAGAADVEMIAGNAVKMVNNPFNGPAVAAGLEPLGPAMKAANMLAEKPAPPAPPAGVLPPPAPANPTPAVPAGTRPATTPATPGTPVPTSPKTTAGGGTVGAASMNK